ncbi:hypothetical protein Tco_0748790 [Tanacetum coccineum]|uniref:Reverse transcriptase domain-containing protein n=1 Tax=Tanacetum coccineum TaxID=301880 RepID=A0ABQ4YWK8_9ASTR
MLERIIKVKSKVSRNSRNKAVVAKVSSNSSTPGISPDVAALTTEVSELKNLMKTMIIDKQKAQAPATVKAVEQSCVTCGELIGLMLFKADSGASINLLPHSIYKKLGLEALTPTRMTLELANHSITHYDMA